MVTDDGLCAFLLDYFKDAVLFDGRLYRDDAPDA